MEYLILLGIMAGLALLPLPLFPSWVVVAYMVVELDLRIALAVVVAAAGTAIGRVGLAAIARVAGPSVLGPWSRSNLDYLHGRLENATGTLGVFGVLAASPPPAGVLYVAAGLLRVPLHIVAAAAFLGRTFSYAIMVTSTSAAAEELSDRLRGAVGPWSVAIAIALVAGALALLIHVDWRVLLEEKRVRLHRGGRRREPQLAPDEAG
ncbi:MAG: hypothetical protein MUE51_10995 [Thermoleophilia bacterium]|jgi:membrane protein YqaA with SNARE-associated domain|nr:hypothetical protein [Thermoleophilia bacterium]